MELEYTFEYVNFRIGSNNIDLYTCNVDMPQITAPRTAVLTFDGIHFKDKSHEDVEAIQFNNGNMQYFPRGVPQIFPHLRVFKVRNCGLLEISRADLSGLQSLERLFLESNKLKSLPSDLLVGMNKLKKVSFFDNQIGCLSSQILASSIKNNMTYIDFRFNKSINAIYAPGHIQSVSSIEELMKIIETKCTKPKEDLSENVYENSSIDTFEASALRAFNNLWKSTDFSDFTIFAGEKEFRLHKIVLAAHSLKFAAMFKDKEKEFNEMHIEDLGVEVVEAFLCYLYTGKVSDGVDASELFALSSKLEVPVLKSISKEMIIDSLQESNALKVFNLGYAYDCDELKQKAFNEIRRTLPDFNLSNDMMEKPEDLKELIEVKELYESMKAKFKKM